jgi:hypothetical protein
MQTAGPGQQRVVHAMPISTRPSVSCTQLLATSLAIEATTYRCVFTMRPSPFFSRTSIASFLSLVPLITAQSIGGGVFRNGNGAPGAAPYQLVDEYTPASFFDQFNFFTGGDPTNGHVQYVDRATALRNGYTTTTNGAARMSVDTTNKFPLGGRGRPAVRLISNNSYTHGMFIADIKHMPTGCGTWPAYWLLGPDPWPTYGEIGWSFTCLVMTGKTLTCFRHRRGSPR